MRIERERIDDYSGLPSSAHDIPVPEVPPPFTPWPWWVLVVLGCSALLAMGAMVWVAIESAS